MRKGNPKHIQTYQDIKKTGATMATVSGLVNADAAFKEGIAEHKVMQVPGLTEVLAAVKAARADAGAGNEFAMKDLVKSAPDDIEVTDSAALPEWTFDWVAIAFKPEDKDFLKAYNKAQAKYLGTPEMLETVGKFQYMANQLPSDTKTDWI
ncbi:transporter substrate-binding domain-containing protein [Mesorhizobium sp. Cs1321R2N1]|uniref:transporter substrate-binding domain-containing protein n=1 Tax=Mesorhizobium sp. Cs1321R2N1 TaxID=3015174 RepID=UPI00301B7727